MKKKKANKNRKIKIGNISIRTDAVPNWCPGCFNFQILAGFQKFLEKQINEEEKKREDFAIVTGIGCHGKMFDYINLPGINTLHGRVLPMCLGMKIANPKLNIFGFAGDGDAYAEGIEHLIHMARYNSNLKYIVHNNQVFALTIAEPTPVTERGYKDKTNPFGVKLQPINPIKIMLASGAGFVARVFADMNQVSNVLEEAQKHRGFCFIEILQPCIIFHDDKGYRERIYDLQKSGHDKTNLKLALEKADEFDYNSIKSNTKIPVGIFYQASEKDKKEIFEEVLRK